MAASLPMVMNGGLRPLPPVMASPPRTSDNGAAAPSPGNAWSCRSFCPALPWLPPLIKQSCTAYLTVPANALLPSLSQAACHGSLLPSCLALPWLSFPCFPPALPSSSNCSRSLFDSTYERPPKRSPRTGKPSAAPKPPKRETEPDARPETPLRQIASDRLPSSQIAISSSPAHLIPLIKPFLPVVPQKQSISFFRSPQKA